jgi:signal transduction histidine kinase
MSEGAIARKLIDEDWRPDEAPVPHAERANILIVDDLPENHLVYRTLLDELHQNLMVASSGEEALKLVLRHEFAVILLDVNMPGMSGFEIATLIRSRRKSAGTPIIFLTAFADEMRMAQGYASGAVDYLPTPVVPEILRAKVRVFIELSQMRRQAALQAEERARRTAAEEADRRKDEFLGMLAHELRNPLAPILNASHLLRRIAPDDKRLSDISHIVDRQVKHMTRLIDDLLDATRLAHGKILLRKERCDITQIVRQTAIDYQSIFDSGQLTLSIDVPEQPIWVEGDPTRLVQTIGNLLHNAHKFTEPGGRVEVRLQIEDDDQTAAVRVSDTGIGIDPRMLPYVFDVFRQADQGLDRTRGGLGLGLALVRGLIELHGGDVAVESDGIGRGTQFTLRMPVAGKPALQTPNPTAPRSEDTTKYRILLIEDNQLTAESTRLLLSHDGYDVETANNGPTGLEAARLFRPQIVLCDIGLPGMDGYQVVRTLREDKELASSYIIAMTGYGRDEDQRRAQEAGFDLHMTKPIDYNDLLHTLANLPPRKK